MIADLFLWPGFQIYVIMTKSIYKTLTNLLRSIPDRKITGTLSDLHVLEFQINLDSERENSDNLFKGVYFHDFFFCDFYKRNNFWLPFCFPLWGNPFEKQSTHTSENLLLRPLAMGAKWYTLKGENVKKCIRVGTAVFKKFIWGGKLSLLWLQIAFYCSANCWKTKFTIIKLMISLPKWQFWVQFSLNLQELNKLEAKCLSWI